MKIAILGWGSLIWDPGSLRIKGDWQTGGPQLPIEFSRISNDGRLTLVIDTENGKNVSSRYVMSSFTNLDDAIENLRKREKTTKKNIGYATLNAETHRSQHSGVVSIIREWLRQTNFDAVVWTDLANNFADKRKSPFSIEAAISYLHELTGEAKMEAQKYIMLAPQEVNTPVRDRLNEIDWLSD